MRLPWIQLAEDGDRRARSFGQLIGIGGDAGVGFVTRLWRAALDLAPEGDFTGRFEDIELLIAHAGGLPAGLVPGSGGVVKELQRVGLLATHPHLRVLGLDRYRSAWLKNNKHLILQDHTPGTPPEPEAKPKRQTETETENLKDIQKPKPKRERKLSAAEEFFVWLTATRKSKTPLSDEPTTHASINAVFGRALHDNGRPMLEKCYLAFLDEPDGASKEPPWPWRSFLARLPLLRLRSTAAANNQNKVLSASERRDLYGANTG